MRLRHARRADLAAVADIWVDAFAQDPFLRWMEPDDHRWPSFGTAWMTFIASLCFERGHTYLTDDGDGAVAWIPPDLTFAASEDIARGRSIVAASAGDERADQVVQTIMAAHAHTMVEPHWTLQYVGVRTTTQATGLGAALLAPRLAVIDAEALPCSLVSSNPRNVPFYQRHGFTVTAEITTPDATATLRPMTRPAARRE